MKIASFYRSDDPADGIAFGVVSGDGLVEVSAGFAARHPSIRHVLAAEALAALAADVADREADHALTDLRYAPPLWNAERIQCVGVNYPKKYPLGDVPPPEEIFLFAKLDGALVGHGAPLQVPQGEPAETFDYEGEFVLVIGKPGRNIPQSRAFEHIAGYTIMDDGSVRGWQRHSVHAGKNFTRSGACGPWMTTADEIADPFAMTLTTRLNGNQVQHTAAGAMIFPIPRIIEYVSTITDLRPGDLIATGSPEGAGASQTPPRFLRDGDVLEIEVSGVGVLSNPVKA